MRTHSHTRTHSRTHPAESLGGADPQILRGAHNTLRARLPRLLVFSFNPQWELAAEDAGEDEVSPARAVMRHSCFFYRGICPSVLPPARNVTRAAPPHTLPPPPQKPTLRSVTSHLFSTYGYACYLYAPELWVPLSGAWWSKLLEQLVWSSIVCAGEELCKGARRVCHLQLSCGSFVISWLLCE